MSVPVEFLRTHVFGSLHRCMRARKLELFFARFRPQPSDVLLDVGGGPGIGGEYHHLHHFFRETTIVNYGVTPQRLGSLHVMNADARQLPFSDESFDWVFSNAVIEHVGTWPDQQKMAAEIRRVARKGYFVTTPNRYFPVDPHTFLPCYHLLAQSRRDKLQRGPLRRYLWASVRSAQYSMLSPRQFRFLFPEAEFIYGALFTSIIALGKAN